VSSDASHETIRSLRFEQPKTGHGDELGRNQNMTTFESLRCSPHPFDALEVQAGRRDGQRVHGITTDVYDT
jgi:hypothetical protein